MTESSQTQGIGRIRRLITDYPNQFWLVVGSSFIDHLGGAMLFPFFTLYLTKKFGINMTTVGVIFGFFSLSSVLGTMIGGAITDRLGRKGMLLFGLVMSALSSVLMGLINEIQPFVMAVFLVGILSDAAIPAQQALVADLLAEEKRASGFGILRVVFNLAVVIGPLIGGLLAIKSYLLLFIADAVTSLITAVIVFFALRETWQPKMKSSEPQESILTTLKDYNKVLRDTAFAWFLIASTLMVLVQIQMNTTLAVFLRDIHGVDERGFSYILSLNASMVVLFQFPISRWIEKFRPLIIMAIGSLFFAIGFSLYGFVGVFFLFLVAMAVITIGEILVSPTSQAIVARLAPEDMRGRYMAVYDFSWVIPFAVGPLLAGLIFDHFNSNYLWYTTGILGSIAAAGFFALELRVSSSQYEVAEKRIQILERLEMNEISADTANQMLESVGEGIWSRLAHQEKLPQTRKMRIQISDSNTGLMKADLHLPIGLVNTVLHVGGTFSRELNDDETNQLCELIKRDREYEGDQQQEKDDRRIELQLK